MLDQRVKCSVSRQRACNVRLRKLAMKNNQSENSLKLGIGGIVMSVASNDSNLSFEAGDERQAFVTSARPEIILQVHRGIPPSCKSERVLFDPGVGWNLHQTNSGYVLRDYSTVAILESDWQVGQIYVDPEEWAGGFPLGSRLNELLIINLLAKGRGVISHACGISTYGEGLLFPGISQAGKSTMANLWKSESGKITVLSDDRIIIRKQDGQFWIYGTPWHGEAKVCSPEKAPLEKIFFLKHAKTNKVERIEGINAASKLLVCSFPTFWDKKGMEFTLGFIDELTREVPCYELEFVPNKTVIDFVKNI
jgi:hypothetical protein